MPSAQICVRQRHQGHDSRGGGWSDIQFGSLGGSTTKFKLAVSFAPQQAGWVISREGRAQFGNLLHRPEGDADLKRQVADLSIRHCHYAAGYGVFITGTARFLKRQITASGRRRPCRIVPLTRQHLAEAHAKAQHEAGGEPTEQAQQIASHRTTPPWVWGFVTSNGAIQCVQVVQDLVHRLAFVRKF
jgi:hypothetical protein